MNKSRGNQQRPRDAEGCFENKGNKAQNTQNKMPKSGNKSNERCRNDNDRFESCDS